MLERVSIERDAAGSAEVELVTMHSDPIADFLTRIRNGYRAKKEYIDAPHSKMNEAIASILKQEGFVGGFEIMKDSSFATLRVHLRYDQQKKPLLRHIRRISKPGLRIYKGYDELQPVASGMGTRILSTNKGLMTDREARKRKVGGEVICEVW